MKADFKILVLSAGLLFSSLVCGPVSCEAANASGNGAMTPAQCAAAMKDLQQQSASLSQQLRSCKTNAVCAPLGVRLNRITQQLLSLKRKCSPALPTGASTAPVKKTASAPSDTDGIDLKDASGEVLDLKASWPDIPEFGSADLSGLSASMDTALLPQKAQAAGDELPICGEDSTICAAPTVCQKPCISAEMGQPGWGMTCVGGEWCGTSGGGGGGNEECNAGKITIAGPADLSLFKPYTDSSEASFRVITSKAPSKIQWSVSNGKIKFTTVTNQPTIQVIPTSESTAAGDTTITVTVDNCPPASQTLTVRRPKFLSHPQPLKFKNIGGWGFRGLGTDGYFWWTLTDQLGDQMPNVSGREEIKQSTGSSLGVIWPIGPFKLKKNWTTLSDGTVSDRYYFVAYPINRDAFQFLFTQKIIVRGYSGDSYIKVWRSGMTGTSPVELK